LFLVNQFPAEHCARGHGATWSGDGRYSSEKMAERKNTAAEGYVIKGECVALYVYM
jgi:hypothetical protein